MIELRMHIRTRPGAAHTTGTPPFGSSLPLLFCPVFFRRSLRCSHSVSAQSQSFLSYKRVQLRRGFTSVCEDYTQRVACRGSSYTGHQPGLQPHRCGSSSSLRASVRSSHRQVRSQLSPVRPTAGLCLRCKPTSSATFPVANNSSQCCASLCTLGERSRGASWLLARDVRDTGPKDRIVLCKFTELAAFAACRSSRLYYSRRFRRFHEGTLSRTLHHLPQRTAWWRAFLHALHRLCGGLGNGFQALWERVSGGSTA